MSALSKQDVVASLLELRVQKAVLSLIEVATVVATGADETDAAPLTGSFNAVTAANGAKGVILPRAKRDTQVEVINTVANQDLLVYPDTGAQINALTATTGAFTQVAGSRAVYVCDADKHWYVAAANLTGTATSASTAELDVLADVTPGTVAASKAVVVDADKDASAFRNLGVVNLDAGASGTAGTVDVFPATALKGKTTFTAADNADNTTTTIITAAQANTRTYIIPDAGAAAAAFVMTEGAQTINGVKTFGNEVDLAGNTTGAPGAGITDGVGTIHKAGVLKVGGIVKTSILLDLTGLSSSTTDLDIIGVGTEPAHIGQITAAKNGTILTGRVTCLEAPVGGIADIDLYSAEEGTGIFDGGIAALIETALLTAGGAWTNGLSKSFTAWPAANEFLYLTGGAGGTAAAYTAGKFLIELEGYDA